MGDERTNGTPTNEELYRHIKSLRHNNEEQWRHIQKLRQEVTVNRATLTELRSSIDALRAEAKDDHQDVIDRIDSLSASMQARDVANAKRYAAFDGATSLGKWIVATLIALSAMFAGWISATKGWIIEFFRTKGGG